MAVISVLLASCSKDDDTSSENKFTIEPEIESMSSRLFNTSWVYQYSEFYNKYNGGYSHTSTDYANKFTFTFSNKAYNTNQYQLIVNGNTSAACWWCIDSNGLDLSSTDYCYRFSNMSASEVGGWSACGGTVFDGQITLTNSKLIVKDYYIDGINYVKHVFVSSGNSEGETSGGSGGSSTSNEKPDVGFYDYRATETSLAIQYKIYNCAEAGVTSAKIYYGTSSNPSKSKIATVSGSLITVKIAGLKSGTTYYVKCVATGKGGTTTTSTTKCVTNY